MAKACGSVLPRGARPELRGLPRERVKPQLEGLNRDTFNSAPGCGPQWVNCHTPLTTGRAPRCSTLDWQYYIRNVLPLSPKVRTLLSSDLEQLNVPRVRTAVGSRAFSVAAPRLSNELLSEICSAKTQISFRKKLKTYFFGQVFSTWILGGPVGPDNKHKRFWNYELDYDYVCRASELGSRRI